MYRSVVRNDDPPDDERPCDVCGLWPHQCICPECPHCGDTGNPSCYVDTEDQEFIDGQWVTVDRKEPNHGFFGLVRTEAQKNSRATQEAIWEADNTAYWEEHDRLEELRHKQALEEGLGMSFDTGPTDAEVDRAQRRLEELFGKEWLEGKE